MFGEMLLNVRKSHPLIHNITNYVTANDCANILLACGASPVMADDEGEVEDVTSLCGGLNIISIVHINFDLQHSTPGYGTERYFTSDLSQLWKDSAAWTTPHLL